jgi:hypothetical protein
MRSLLSLHISLLPTQERARAAISAALARAAARRARHVSSAPLKGALQLLDVAKGILEACL